VQLLKRAQTAIEQLVAVNKHDETVLKQSRFWIRAITWGLVGTAGLSVAWLSLAQTEEIVVATGKLEPVGSVKDIQMPLGGVTAAVLVKEGQNVKAGQVVMQLDSELTSVRAKNLARSMAQKDRQIVLKQLELNRYMDMNFEETGMLARTYETESLLLKKLGELVKAGATAELQYIQQRNKTQEAKAKLKQAKIDKLRQEAIFNQQIQQLKADLNELRNQVAETKVTLRYQSLRSPVDGVVFDLKPKAPGYTAQTTEAVMKIVPHNSLEAKVQVASSKIGFVRAGMPVDVSVDSYPATDFGVIPGTVRLIGSDALTADPARQQSEMSYPCVVQLTSQWLESANDQRLPLQVGMSVTAYFKLRRVSYLQLMLGEFRNKADALRAL